MGKNIFSGLSKRKRYIVYIFIIVILVVFFSNVIIRPVISRLDKLNKEIFIQEKKLARSARILSQGGFIADEYKKFTYGLKQDGSDEEEVAKLLSEIEKLAKKTSVFLANIKPRLTEKKEHYRKYVITVEVESEITNLIDFFYQLEASPRLLRVEEFYLTPRKEGSNILKARITINEVLIK